MPKSDLPFGSEFSPSTSAALSNIFNGTMLSEQHKSARKDYATANRCLKSAQFHPRWEVRKGFSSRTVSEIHR